MIAQLIRQDPAFRRLPLWVLVAMGCTSAAVTVIAWITARRGPVGLELLAALSWLSIALYLVFGDIGTRTNRFNLSLPVSARELWLSHFIAVGLTGMIILAMSAVVTTGSLILMRKIVGGWQGEPGALAVLGSLLAAGLLFAVGIIHAFRPDAQEVPLSLRRAGWSLVAAAVPLGLALVLRPLGALGVAIVLGLAAATFLHVFRAIPEALSVPTEAQRASAAAPSDATGPASWATTQRPTGLWFALRVVHGVTTCAKKPVAIWIVTPFLLFLGFWESGIDARWISSTQRFAYPFMIVYVVMVVTTLSLARLGAIDWLPWCRRRTLALLVMPLLLCVAAGYGVGRITDTVLGERADGRELLCFVEDRESGEPRLCVLWSACEISWSGKPSDLTAPWGEAHEPWSEPVVRGLPVRVYFPYEVPPGSSVDFAALQISRAAGALFGADIPPDEIRSRYLEADVDGSTLPGTPALTLQADYPELRRVGRGVYFPWIMAMIVVLWSLLTAGYIHWLRAGVSERKRKIVGGLFVAVPMLLWVLDFVLTVTEVSEIPIRNAFIFNLSRSAGETPAGVAVVWVGSALVGWAAYRLVERRFERAELSMKPIGRQP
jgi:hypothetical protein